MLPAATPSQTADPRLSAASAPALLKSGALGSRLVRMAQAAAAIHMVQHTTQIVRSAEAAKA
jgi:hypothetical protein